MDKRKIVSIRVSDELHQQLRLEAAVSLRSLQNIVTSAIRSYLSYKTLSDIPPAPRSETLDKSV